MSARLLTIALFAAAASFACANEKDSGDTVTGKDATTDTKKDGATGEDTGATEDTSSGTDTGTSTGDSSTTDTGSAGDGGGGSCDKHAGDECNMVKQDCADVAATCEYDSTLKHNTCTKRATGTATKGQACTKPEDCDKGLFCYSNKCAPACCSGDNSVCNGTDVSGGTCNLAITDTDGAVIYHACSYSAKCNPFKYDCPSGQVCLFSEAPDLFKCSTPASGSSGLGTAPGGTCMYTNDCGESQACFSLTSGGDASAPSKCYLFCWLTKPDSFTPGSMPGGRFAADGTCTVGGTSYGTCTSIGTIGGGLGICVK